MQTKSRRKFINSNRYIIILAVILIIIVAVFIFLNSTKKQENDKINNPLPFKTLYDFSDNPPQIIDVNLLNGTNYTLFNNDNKISFKDNNQQKVLVNEDSAKRIINFLTKISVENTVSDEGEIEPEMGLEPANLKVDVTYNNGEKISLLCGNQVPLSKNMYFKIKGEKGIYAISPGFYEVFNLQTDRLRSFEKLPIHRNLIKKIIYQKTNEESFSINILAFEKGRVYGNVVGDYTYPSNPVLLNNICNSLDDIVPGAFVKDFETKDIDSFGFNGPSSLKITVEQNSAVEKTDNTYEQNISFVLGNDAEEYQKYLLYDDTIYRVSTILIAPIIQGNFENLLSKEPFPLSLDEISNISSIYDDVDGVINKWQITANQSNQEISILKNDKDYDIYEFKEIIKNLVNKSANIKLDKYISDFSEKPLRSITINFLNGQKHTVEFFYKDEYHDMVRVNGIAIYAWPKEYTKDIMPR